MRRSLVFVALSRVSIGAAVDRLPARILASPRHRPRGRRVGGASLRGGSMAAAAASSTTAAASKNVAPRDAAYPKLCERLREVSFLEGAAGLLGWDEMVMLPDGASDARGKQKAALSACIHDKMVDKELGELIASAESTIDSLEPAERANIRDARRKYDRVTKCPRELVARQAEMEVEGFQKWRRARESKDFSVFADVLGRLVDLKKEVASLIDPELDPYDVCIDTFERGMTSARIDEVFTELRNGIVPLLERIRDKLPSQPAPKASLEGSDKWDTAAQALLCKDIAAALGFDFERGRLDVSVHPFTGGSDPTDVRITTRYSTENPWEGIMGTVHEVGHAMYEQGRNAEYAGLPVSEALSLSAHESQSLLWERCIGQCRAMWRFCTPLVHKHLPHTRDADDADFYREVNRVRPECPIRVDTDEVTYPLHVIVRFELEKALFDGTLSVEDLPRRWNEKFREYLGITPDSDATGVLQDMHWSYGMFGYFPTYTLGAMTAAQLYRTMQEELPDLDKNIAAGDFKAARQWLNDKVHTVGSLYASLDELLTAVTGEPLRVRYFVDYLTNKYGALLEL